MFFDKVFLASQSPRRRELIRYLFDTPELLNVSFEEPKWVDEPPLDYLDLCVGSKWEQAQSKWQQAAVSSGLLVADTIVSHNGRVLGKPTDSSDAIEMLKELSGSWHKVFTGFRLGRREGSSLRLGEVVIVDTAVKFSRLSLAQIRDYVKTKEPLDKAGSYGLQDRALTFVEQIRGSYTNVVGLPVERIRAEARRLGFH